MITEPKKSIVPAVGVEIPSIRLAQQLLYSMQGREHAAFSDALYIPSIRYVTLRLVYDERMRVRTQESRTAAARAMLIGATIELLADEGIARATSASIALKAGVSTGALHHHFPVKEKLFLAVLDELVERALALFEGLGSSKAYSASPARAIVDDLWHLYGSKQYWAVWEINMGYRADEEMRRALVQHRADTREKMLDTLQTNPHLSVQVKQALIPSLNFILSSMRGIFLDTFFARADDSLVRTELDSLVSVLEGRFAKV